MRSVIVCVDDEWDILKSLGDQLKHHFGKAYDIELAKSGEDALSLCAELTAEGKAIALIISDQRMQRLEGDALLIQLHTLYPKTLKIMLTGQANADAVGNVVNAAALYRYIRKPWDETDLILTVTEALRRFQQEQQLGEQNEQLKKVNAKLESSLALLLSTLEATADGILVLDRAGKVVSFNQKFVSIWHLKNLDFTAHEEDLVEMLSKGLSEPDTTQFQAVFTQLNTEKHGFLKFKNGSIIQYYSQPHQLAGESVGSVWSFRDVTQEKQTEAIIKHQALHDGLTNLPNRILFHQKFADTLHNTADDTKLMAVLFLDLDRFKEVNDTFGHAVGDCLLQEVVQRLSKCLREGDLIARWGGDEFVLLLTQIRCRSNVTAIAKRLIEGLQPQFILAGYHLDVTASVGIAMYPQDGLDSSTLLQNADVALYQAKKCGRNNYQYYSVSPITST
ncbi:MAG: diguanylate cyclase [Scytolyngbya sp. HA4215-MV1]|jgi:diguanylate cyclase (GGDEF)-like protein/PAS domain S-box-containing protein|nr:diguanylate cyclase [Scytolyngbya sp. HA4215-MV1]